MKMVQFLGSNLLQPAHLPPPRRGDWICTYTGVRYYPLDPRAREVRIEDIAMSLSKLCRYGGHARDFYSVAEHSVLASYLVAPRFALRTLMHDATEAYVMDLPRPIKRNIPLYKHFERLNELAINARFGFVGEMPEAVHEADEAMLMAEKPVLLPPTEWDARDISPEAADIPIFCWGHAEAALQFLARFNQLAGENS